LNDVQLRKKLIVTGLLVEYMDRRRFLKLLPVMGSVSLGSVSLLPFSGRASGLGLPTLRGFPGKALVIIALKGGNDGLNMVIPLEQYDVYRNLRPGIGLSDAGLTPVVRLDTTLPLSRQVALHPSMVGLKKMYERGWVSVLQGVGNGTGGPLTADLEGCMLFPGTAFRKDVVADAGQHPFCLQMGDPNTPLGQHGESAHISVLRGLGWNDAGIQGLLGGQMPICLPELAPVDQIEWISELDGQFPRYADKILTAYNRGTNAVRAQYPDTRLSGQLRAISRLIDGGCMTPIFVCQLGGFDTHVAQVEDGNPSEGIHSMLLKTLSEAVLAFMNDLQQLGLSDRVMVCTYSEFGRSYGENATLGTEHGALAPMMLFGSDVTPGIFGAHSDIANPHSPDPIASYRQIVDAVCVQWLGLETVAPVRTACQV
jgi:uncharacterized protein (DUF1501 family)